MSKRTFTDEQIVKILEEGERTEESKAEFCRRHGISESALWNKWVVCLRMDEYSQILE